MILQLDLSDEQIMLGEMLERFVTERCASETRLAHLHATPPRRLALWRELCELGVPAALLPPEAGGFGGTARDVAVVQYALAPGLLVEPLLVSVATCGAILHAAGRTVDALLSGDAIYAFAHQEGFDAFAAPRLRFDRDGDSFVLNGLKPAVRHGDVAHRLILSASGPDDEIRLFDLPVAADGIATSTGRLIDAAGSADFLFDNVTVGADAALGVDAPSLIRTVLLKGLAALCAEAASLAQATVRTTGEYLNVREQFGVPLSSFQALQHRIADMLIAAEEMSAQARQAAILADGPASDRQESALLIASLACDNGGQAVGHGAIQLHGGMGVSDETQISHYARRFAAIRAQIGTSDARAARLARLEGFCDA
ncbi:Acyl-CoA dehydrogenase [Sphingobium faniae]|nr:Acyl-CoA dehydrogenase [Sphingobium faniae]